MIVVSVIWAITSFSFYQILFKLKSLPGDVFVNSSISSIANAAGHFISVFIYKWLAVKKSMIFNFALMLLGSLPLLMQFWHNETYTATIVPICVLLCTFGAAS